MRWQDAVERVDGDFGGRLVLTCEHASAELPSPWAWHPEDEWLLDTHWVCDIGAGAFTRRLAELMHAPAILSGFSRLLVDPNRPLDSATLFRSKADGRTVRLNERINAKERERRVDGFYRPYHQAASAMVEQSSAEIVFAVHTFTDDYEGVSRSLELGVLFDREEELANDLVRHLDRAGFHVAPNEPWSGKEGLAYSAILHADQFDRRGLEIEVRQDLVVDDAFAARVAAALGDFFS